MDDRQRSVLEVAARNECVHCGIIGEKSPEPYTALNLAGLLSMGPHWTDEPGRGCYRITAAGLRAVQPGDKHG